MPYNDPDPKKDAARMQLMRALRKGSVVRPDSCVSCHDSCKPQAHHNDYDKPLDVDWLCTRCHYHVHKFYSGVFLRTEEERYESMLNDIKSWG